MNPTYISFANSKGGVAKTTTTVNLAYLLAKKYRTLVVDLDFQMNASLCLGIVDSPSLLTAYKDKDVDFKTYIERTPYKNLDILPANTDLLNFPREAPLDWLRTYVRRLPYDFVLFDTSPSLSHLTVMSFVAADHLIVPTTLHAFSREGVHTLMSVISALRPQSSHVCRLLGILLTLVDRSQEDIPRTVNEFRALLGKQVFQSEIPYSRKITKGGLTGLAVETSPRSKVAVGYRRLSAEILMRLLPDGQN